MYKLFSDTMTQIIDITAYSARAHALREAKFQNGVSLAFWVFKCNVINGLSMTQGVCHGT